MSCRHKFLISIAIFGVSEHRTPKQITRINHKSHVFVLKKPNLTLFTWPLPKCHIISNKPRPRGIIAMTARFYIDDNLVT